MKYLFCLALVNLLVCSLSARSYYQGARSRPTRSDQFYGVQQEVESPEGGMQMDGRPCGSLCYIMKLERLARELGVQNKDKRFDGYLYDFVGK